MNKIHEAMDIMATRGMAKDKLEDYSGRVCVFGAIACAVNGSPLWTGGDTMTLMDVVGGVAAEQYPERTCGFTGGIAAVEVNNHPQTTQGEMLVIMDKAAVLLDERG